MRRRDFMSLIIGGIATSTAIRTWPFRVYSFPTEIVIPSAWPAGFVSLELLQEAFKNKHSPWGGLGGPNDFRPAFPRQKLMPWQEGYVSGRKWVDELPDEAPSDWKPIRCSS